jgi:N-acylneuraminate cytidylyltransferase
MEKTKSVAIITARGGSKRIPRKNIKPFAGFPIIKYSIEAALKADTFDEVMVSTDDREIAEISTSLGAAVPFFRSAAASNDHAGTAEVILEVIEEYRKRGKWFEHLCCIYPTAPFVTPEKLKTAMALLIEQDVDAVLPITRFSYPIQRSLKLEEGWVRMNWPENYHTRSQDLMPVYHDCGQFYCLKTRSLVEQEILYCKRTLPVIIPESEVQDIDNEEDWKIAEIKFKMARSMA